MVLNYLRHFILTFHSHLAEGELHYYLVTLMQLFYYQCIASLCYCYLVSNTIVYENGRS